MNQVNVGRTCPYCQYLIKQEVEAVQCAACQIPHHRECWEANGGCTTFGCQTKNYVFTEVDRGNSILNKTKHQAVGVSDAEKVNKLLAVSLIIAMIVITIQLVGFIDFDVGEIANFSESKRDELDLPEHIEQLVDAKDDDMVFEKYENIPMQVDETQIFVIGSGDYLLALVSRETSLQSEYEPSDLVQIPSHMQTLGKMYLRAVALGMLEELWAAAEADSVNLEIHAAYRSYSDQNSLFDDYCSRYGQEETERYIARPGQSEHQLGTTVDFGGTAFDLQVAYFDTIQGRWLDQNAHRYGFVMSYPAGKEHITGYIFQPWHYRYIGVDVAMELKLSGKTLREYLETKPQFYL